MQCMTITSFVPSYALHVSLPIAFWTVEPNDDFGGRTGLVVRASDSGSGDPGSILGRVGVLFP